MELEIYRYVPHKLVPDDLMELDIEELLKLYAKAKYMQDVESSNMQKAIAQAFSGDE